VPVDYNEAAHWSRLAAEQGLPHAATNYAYLCEQGKGVPRDYVAAYLWYSRAAAAGDKTAAAPLKAVAHHLTRAQKDQANSQLAADASHPQPPEPGGATPDVSLMVSP
jgi:TPR repeat protein